MAPFALMDKTKRRTIEGWIDKASNQLAVAREHSKSIYRSSEAIQAAQECVELSVKSILSLLDIRYARSHEWAMDKKEFAAIAQQIQGRRLLDKLAELHLEHTVRLPRLLMLMNFWAQFYIAAKYGLEVEHLASARELFQTDEAQLAVRHAEECFRAASYLRHFDAGKLSTLES